MAKSKDITSVHDSIKFKSIDTGDQSVGNGGDGYFKGSVSNSPSIKFDPSNKAEGSDVHVKTGDYVSQKASWDADGGDAKAWKHSKAEGGDAKSNGDQSSSSGYDTSKVYANTTAEQSNYLKADMHQEVAAGIGGDGGNDNLGMGGDVSVHIDTF